MYKKRRAPGALLTQDKVLNTFETALLKMPAFIESPQWTAPVDYQSRNVVVLGGGVLGRRIGKSQTRVPAEYSTKRSHK